MSFLIVKIKGGIGNQLFQYAFAKYLEKNSHQLIKLDYSSCVGCSDITCENRLKYFNISVDEVTQSEMKDVCLSKHNAPLLTRKYKIQTLCELLFNKSYYFEKQKNRQFIDYSSLGKKRYFDGYWQSWKYVYEVRDELNKDLIFNNEISQLTKQTIFKIQKEEAVFIGIRRGDYISSKKARKRYGSFSKEYYVSAMKYVSDIVRNPVFYIFSNDIDWCKKNLDFNGFNVVYREPHLQTNDLEELLIMSSCKHAIIVNSTFHWWGAFLIKNPNKIVVAPNEWFCDGTKIDIVPNEWVRMNRNGEPTK